jgi:alkaline phosphatase D
VAQQAYFEWMPMLPNASGGLWRSKRVGDLLDLHLLDTRIEGRADQLPPDDTTFRSVDRHMLGPVQEQWLARSLAAPAKPWTVVLSSVILSNVAWPEPLRELFGTSGPSWGRQLLEQRIARSALGAGNPDAWDGYPAAQERLQAMLRDRSGRTLILSGDTHSSWAFRLPHGDGAPLGWEVGVPSVTTEASLDSLSGSAEAIEALFRSRNPHLDFLHPSARGYVVVEIEESTARIEWRYVSSVTTQAPTWRVGKRMQFPAE